jgi:NAD(P)H-nitrite reductase large subunit
VRVKNNLKKDNEQLIEYIIIGNSAAGLAAAESIRELDRAGKVMVLTEEGCLNYSKPMITYFLAGIVGLDKIYFKDEKFYRDNNIDIRLNTRVKSIDTDKMFLISDDGSKYKFRKLLIASGGKPIAPEIRAVSTRTLKSGKNIKDRSFNFVNGTNYGRVGGIFTLTTLEDAIGIKDYIEKNGIKEISILGGGLIGLKAAEAFLEIGINVNIIELADRILAATFDRQASSIIEKRIKSKSSNIYRNNTIEEIYIKNGKINGYKLKDGREMECSLLVIAIGVNPDTSFIGRDILEINRGIVVDDYMRASAKNIYAAGDVVEGLDILLGENRNIAIWPLAVRQGAVAGINMAGGNKRYSGGFFMNSVEILGIPSISMGLTDIEDKEEKGIEVLKDFNPDKNTYKKVVIRNNRIIGVILVGNIERAGIYAGLIRNGIDISSVKENISKEDFGIIHLPADYKKHLVVGEGIEV